MRHAACYEPQCIPAGQIYYFRTGHGAQYVHAHLARLRFARLCLENSLGGVDIADILLRSFPTIILCNTPRAHSSYRDWPHVRSGPSSHSTHSLSLSRTRPIYRTRLRNRTGLLTGSLPEFWIARKNGLAIRQNFPPLTLSIMPRRFSTLSPRRERNYTLDCKVETKGYAIFNAPVDSIGFIQLIVARVDRNFNLIKLQLVFLFEIYVSILRFLLFQK